MPDQKIFGHSFQTQRQTTYLSICRCGNTSSVLIEGQNRGKMKKICSVNVVWPECLLKCIHSNKSNHVKS